MFIPQTNLWLIAKKCGRDVEPHVLTHQTLRRQIGTQSWQLILCMYYSQTIKPQRLHI